MAGLIRRGKKYYAIYRVGGREIRKSLKTDVYQIAKDRIRNLESELARGHDNPFPTQTPIADVLTWYVEHIRAVKRPKSAQTDIYYLRQAFGPVCDAVADTRRRASGKARRKKPAKGVDRRRRRPTIEANYFEDITTAQVSEFIAHEKRSRNLAPKTANRFREILTRLFNWAVKERGIRLPGNHNPAAAVSRYKEQAPVIEFLTLDQIDAHLQALVFRPQLRAMVAMYIYAGLRREEALWLQKGDIDLDAGTYGMIRIHAKTVAGEYWQPKTARNRAVPISSSLRAALDLYRCPKSDHAWYFPSPEGQRYDPDNFSRDLTAAFKDQEGLTSSCLIFRHTFGSQLAMKGESLYKVSSLLGNSPDICRRHYAALLPQSLSDSVEFLPCGATKTRAGKVPFIPCDLRC